jgi:hypothetical protein
MLARIDQFANVEIGTADLVEAIEAGARHVEALAALSRVRRFGLEGPREPLLDLALSAGLQSVNALLAVSAARCRIAPPPPADVEMVTDAAGELIYRCLHKKPHRWKLDGTPLP